VTGSYLFVAPNGWDQNACSPNSPCATFDRAYHAAQPGQTVEVAGGVYAPQTITPDATKNSATARVRFMPAPGASVSVLGPIKITGSHVEFDNFTAKTWAAMAGQTARVTDVVMRNMTVSSFGIFGASNVQVLGGSVGPAVDTSSNIANCYQCTYTPSNIVVSGVFFHDYVRTSSLVHMECLHVWPATQLRVTDNKFRNCAIMDLFLSNYGSGANLNSITIENNVFDLPGSLAGGLSHGFYSLVIGPFGRTASNILIDYNSFLAAPNFSPNASYSNVRVDSNVGPFPQFACTYGGAGITFAYNVWGGAVCGPTDIQAPSGFQSPGSLNLYLLPGAAAINHGDPSSYPSSDINGQARPIGGRADAGAYEG
jgi:hypothetical protein